MIARLEDRSAALMAHGWTRREAEWVALVCLHGGAPFDSAPLENPSSDIDTAVSILVGVFGCFIRGAGPGNWTWSEIADDLVKRVEYEQRNRPQAFKQAIADLVRPFHRVLSYSGAV